MKHYFKQKFSAMIKLFGLVTLLSTTNWASAQLTGSYTIDPSVAASSTNFQTWAALATYFNTNGISGATTVTVKGNDIAGTSVVTFTQHSTKPTTSTNTLTIDGGGFKLTSSYAYEVLGFNGIDYVTLKNAVIENSNTSYLQSCIRMYAAADYNTIKSCTLQLSSLTTGSTAGAAYFAFASSASALNTTSTTHNGSYNTVDGCLMRTTNSNSPGPTYAILDLQGTSYYTSTASNNTFSNNTIQNFYYKCIQNWYTNGEQFTNNDFSRANATSNNCSSTMQLVYSTYTYSTNRSTKFDGNKFHDLPYSGASSSSYLSSTVYGIIGQYNTGNSTNYFTVTNNVMTNIHSAGTTYLGYMLYNYYTNVTGNIVSKWNSYGTGYFNGWYFVYAYSDLKFNKNVMRDCFTKYYTYFIQDQYGDKKQINGNKYINNISSDGNYGYTYVMYLFYPSMSYTNECNNNVIDSNTFGYYTYGVYQYYWNGTFNGNKITNNRVYNASTSSNGAFYVTQFAYFYNMQINNNLIANNTGYYNQFGIYAYSYNSGSYSIEVRQNTLRMDDANNGYSYGFNYGWYLYPYYHTTVDFTGNITDLNNIYYIYPVYTYNMTTSNYKRWDYNNYYFNNVQNQYWYCPGGSANNFAGWNSMGFAGTSETNVNPKWRNTKTDFRSNAFMCHNNVPNPAGYFPTTGPNKVDLTNALRNTFKSDRGAIESPMNIQALKTDFSIAATVCAGYTSASTNLYVKNKFADTVYNFNIAYAVNGGAKTSQLIKTKIAPGATLKVDFNLPIGLTVAGKTAIKIFVDAFDDTLKDDTFTFNTIVLPAPGGATYVASTKSTPAIYQYGKSFDVTVLNAPLYYDIPKPRVYTNASYGTSLPSNWYAEVQAYTASKRAVTGASVTPPSGSADMEVKFVTNDVTLEDSTLTLVLRVIDNNNNCDTFVKRNVLIYPSIKDTFTFPTKICNGDAVLFQNKCTVRSGSMEFMWDFGTGNKADTSAAPEPVFQYSSNGTFNVTLTAKTQPWGFVFTKTIPVTVNAIPTVAFTKANACQGKSLTFNNTTTPSSAIMNWNFGDNNTSKLTNPTHKYAAPGTYSVTLKADLNGCIATVVQKVYQFDKPTAAFVLKAGNCDNETFSFTNKTTIISGLVGSFWDFNDNGSVSTDLNPDYKFATAGNKKVMLVATSEFGCADTIFKTVSVKESPKTAYINTPLCSVKPTDFTNTSKAVAGTNADYTWDFGDGSTSKMESPTHDWNAKLGPKTVSFTIVLDNGCSQSVSKDLVVLTQPRPNFSASDVCAGDDVVFVNNTTWPQGDISYKWDFGDGTTSTNSDPSKKYITSVTLTPNVTLYAYIAGGCADSITQKITINEAPRTCDFIATPDYASGFYGMKVEPMNGSGIVGGQQSVNYVWVFEGGGTKKTSDKNAATSYDFPTDGTYKVTMRAKMQQTACECSVTKNVVMNRASAKDLQTSGVAVYPNPAVSSFNVALTETFGQNINISVMSMSGQLIKTVSTTNTGLINVDASSLSSGVYMVQISNGNQVVTRKINIQK